MKFENITEHDKFDLVNNVISHYKFGKKFGLSSHQVSDLNYDFKINNDFPTRFTSSIFKRNGLKPSIKYIVVHVKY